MSRPTSRHAPPALLVEGAVRGWHILFLYVLIFVSMIVASGKLTAHMAPEIRISWQLLLLQAMSASLVAIVTLAVPELRRSLPALYARARAGLDAADVALFIAVMVAWTFGAHRFLVLLPLLRWDPGLFGFLGFSDHFTPDGGASALFVLLATVFVAPVAEELLFRGYLLNLWMRRWGTWTGIVLSSLVFGLAHFQFAVFAAVAGVFFALVYLRFGSLWPGTLLHALFNVIGGSFGIAPYFLQKSRAEALSLSSWIPEMVLTIAFVPLLYLFWRRFRPTT